jgi:hypothetical protein
MQVFRYVISPEAPAEGDEQTDVLAEGFMADVELISGAQILDVGFTSKGVTCWALVEPANQASETRTFFVCGNGVDLPEGIDAINFRGVAKVIGGPTAHVFEVAKVTA